MTLKLFNFLPLRNHLPFLSILLVLAFALPSCNPARQIAKGKLRKKSDSFLLKKLEQNRVKTDWFSGKSKVAFSGDGQQLKASANILMRTDSLIWMNVKKLGIEVARVQINQDSIYFLNRLTREYAVWDMTFLQKQFGLPLGFEDLQELILGNSVLVDKANLEAGVKDIQHLLSGQQAGVNTQYALNGLTYCLEQILVSDLQKTWQVQIDQGEHSTNQETVNFPYFRNFAIDSEQTGPIELEIKFLKVELNTPKNIKFEIPDRYTQMR